jgi:hypothetical protein
MEEMGMSLNLEEFIDAANRLYKSVSLPEKNILVKRQRSNSARSRQEAEPKFQPKINENSKRLAERKNSGDVGSRLYNKHAEYEQKKQFMRNTNVDKELLGCTFKPNLVPSQGSGMFGGSETQTFKPNTLGATFNENINSQNINGLISSGASSVQIHTPAFDMTNLAEQLVNNFIASKKQSKEYLLPL